MAVDRRLLLLGRPERISRPRSPGGGASDVQLPSAARQGARLTPKFNELQQAFDAQRAELADSAEGAQPEQVLVLEIIGTVDEFTNAVRRVPGLEWLAEWDDDEVPPDDDFHREGDADRTLSGRLFLLMSNQTALEQLLRLWNRYQADPDAKFDYGLGRFKTVFQQLRNIRRWGPEDRLIETQVLQSWSEQLSLGPQTVRFEAELWYRPDPTRREAAESRFRTDVEDAGGRILNATAIEDIAYHAVLAELPNGSIQAVVDQQREAPWVRCNDVMLFAAVGQTITDWPDDASVVAIESAAYPLPEGAPIVAILDGFPVANHDRLSGRIIIDDPDGLEATYPVRDRIHGTAMSSAIVWGDLSANEPPLRRPVYVRPVMEPRPSWHGHRGERLPQNRLTVDIIHQAIRRLFEEEAGGPAAPSIKVVNMSLGDPSRVFDRSVSAWASLLDWLAYKYRLLIIVSAGNHPEDLSVDSSSDQFNALDGPSTELAVLRAIQHMARIRRLLAPAESVNSLTVGAAQSDASGATPDGLRFDPFATQALPSPISALGLGYRRAVKPDLLLPGGRQMLIRPPSALGPPIALPIDRTETRAPGVRVATPGVGTGDLRATAYLRGTSVAAALASRMADTLLDDLNAIRAEQGPDGLDDRLDAVLIKALIVHSASWQRSDDALRRALPPGWNSQNTREHLARFVGYGLATPNRVRGCPPNRATLLRAQEIGNDESHVYAVPLPPSLNGSADWRRLTVTLAWLTPIDTATRAYRRAALTVVWPGAGGPLAVGRSEVDARATWRGTVQHEVWEGRSATTYADGAQLILRVDCRSETRPLEDPVPYALVVSLEVREEVAFPIYDEVRARVRPVVTVQAT